MRITYSKDLYHNEYENPMETNDKHEIFNMCRENW